MTMASVLNRINFGVPVWNVKLKVLVRRKNVPIDKVPVYADAMSTAHRMASFEWYYTRDGFLACGDPEDPTLKTITVELVVDENLDWLGSHLGKLAWEYYGFKTELRKDNLGSFHLLPFGRE